MSPAGVQYEPLTRSIWAERLFGVLYHHPTSVSCCRGLPTDRYMWSDATGLQECTKAGTKPPSLQWTWVSPASLCVQGLLPCPSPTQVSTGLWVLREGVSRSP